MTRTCVATFCFKQLTVSMWDSLARHTLDSGCAIPSHCLVATESARRNLVTSPWKLLPAQARLSEFLQSALTKKKEEERLQKNPPQSVSPAVAALSVWVCEWPQCVIDRYVDHYAETGLRNNRVHTPCQLRHYRPTSVPDTCHTFHN